ncbi:uncharacterized protein [Diadema setosum]|uniref:uncharacterized protein n=1 Tax=Diadema setosum TaxID=31175 RepID=UPI003B3ABF28
MSTSSSSSSSSSSPTSSSVRPSILSTPSLPSCGGTLYLGRHDSFTIKSPNYPRFYPPNQRCSWIILVAQGSTINATFRSIDLRGPADYVKVYDGPPTNARGDASPIVRASGSTIPPSFQTSGDLMTVVFVSGFEAVERTGFVLALNDVSDHLPIGAPTSNSTMSVHLSSWVLVLITLVLVVLIILAVVLAYVYWRRSCRGSIVADFQAWQLLRMRCAPSPVPAQREASVDSLPIGEPGNGKAAEGRGNWAFFADQREVPPPVSVPSSANSNGGMKRDRAADIEGSPCLPTSRKIRHIHWQLPDSPNRSYSLIHALVALGEDDDDSCHSSGFSFDLSVGKESRDGSITSVAGSEATVEAVDEGSRSQTNDKSSQRVSIHVDQNGDVAASCNSSSDDDEPVAAVRNTSVDGEAEEEDNLYHPDFSLDLIDDDDDDDDDDGDDVGDDEEVEAAYDFQFGGEHDSADGASNQDLDGCTVQLVSRKTTNTDCEEGLPDSASLSCPS